MTMAKVKAIDVREAARLTHNRIIQERLDRAEQIVARRKRRKDRWKKILSLAAGPPPSDESWASCRKFLLEHDRWVRVFPEQLSMCRVIIALAEGAIRAAPKTSEAMMELSSIDMSTIEIGWREMVDEDKQTTKAELPKDQPKSLLRTDEPLLATEGKSQLRDTPDDVSERKPKPLAPTEE